MLKEQKTNIFVPSILAVLIIFSVGLKTSTLYASPEAPFYQVQTVPSTGDYVFIKNTDGENSWAADEAEVVTIGINDNTDSQGLGLPDGGFSGNQGAVFVFDVTGLAGNGGLIAISSAFPTSEGGPGGSGIPLNLKDVFLQVDVAFDIPEYPEITSLNKVLNFWVKEVDGDVFEFEEDGYVDLTKNWQTYELELGTLPVCIPTGGGVFGDSEAILVGVEIESPDSTSWDTIICFIDNFRLLKSGQTIFFEDFELSNTQPTPTTMLAETALFIMDEVDAGNIAPELEGGLLAKIDAALASLDRGNPNDAKVAMNDLKALIKQVEAQIDKKITPEAAAEIIQQVNAIIAALGG